MCRLFETRELTSLSQNGVLFSNQSLFLNRFVLAHIYLTSMFVKNIVYCFYKSERNIHSFFFASIFCLRCPSITLPPLILSTPTKNGGFILVVKFVSTTCFLKILLMFLQQNLLETGTKKNVSTSKKTRKRLYVFLKIGKPQKKMLLFFSF